MSNNSPNMSYCQMRNTLAALRQAREAMEGMLACAVEDDSDLPLNRDEHDACMQLIEECSNVVSLIAEASGDFEFDGYEFDQIISPVVNSAQEDCKTRRDAIDDEEGRVEGEGWTDPAGGWHPPGEEDPASQYE